ncbi:ATP-dependent DNA helicase [Thermoanaerobacterium sp. RBIITD]|uniref:ATP-dependent DNA helicase n=1 Tax=Thermoanaerobacterium sp. RBIITD TaxID=1550240 RepID=UPI000BB69726|nr:ATP-dependent DNA helicase [Thermoanaerobacterium sp. RBIITD]SNX54845.1 Rad3-related DNA helicase [Thermoanaerobacterium sp. RBIITD]
MNKQNIKISVRDLVEFIMRCGDLNNEFVGRSNNRALEGSKIHRKIQRSQAENYQKEVTLKHNVEYSEFILTIEGRADGIYNDNDMITVDEIKTTTASLDDIDVNYNPLHLAQAKCYAYIYGMQNDLVNINVQLTYYNIDTDEIRYLKNTFSIEELKKFFDDLVRKYYDWAKLSYDWIIERNDSIKKMDFPYKDYRKGQRELAVAVYRTVERGKKLFVQAPTGIGKTISTIFPAVKAMGEELTSKIFYLTAKTITRTVAEDAFNRMKDNGLKFKTLVLTAKEKICFIEKPNCSPETCEYAEGHFDRVNDAIMDILKHEHNYSKEIIEKYAKKHRVCPFEFSLDLSLWADAVICDYNHVFDPNVSLKRFFQENNDFTLLIDEAHNLVDRSREMFSAEINKKQFLDAKKLIKDKGPKIKKVLNNINKIFLKLKKLCGDNNYYIIKDGESELFGYLRQLVNLLEEYLLKKVKIDEYENILDLYFDVLKYLKISDLYDDTYTTYVEMIGYDVKIKLFCLDPSKLLFDIMKKCKSSIFFSATMLPLKYYRSILGGNDDDYMMYLYSPFDVNNREILIADNVSTKYKDREKTYQTIVDYIDLTVNGRIGNYMVFFPSYEYMNKVYKIFRQKYPEKSIYIQESGMSDEERYDFLNLFQENNDGLIGFCVLGGVFSEGIDLKHNRLIGAIIVGVGLPQICLERNLIRDYFDRKYGLGYEFAYMYPGMNKVMQAAGRVIRTETDKGVILLIDERYSHRNYVKLFPKEWFPNMRVNIDNIGKHLDKFWSMK